MNKIYWIVLVIAGLFITLMFKKEISHSETLSSRLEELKSTLIHRSYVEQKLWFNSLQIREFLVSDFNAMDIIVKNEKSQELKLGEISSGAKTIFLRYYELGCNTCTEQVISLINEMKLEVNYLSNYSNKGYLNTFKRMNGIKQEVLNLEDQQLFSIDTLKVPYLFIIDRHNKISDVHIPISDDLSFTQEFLSSLQIE